MNNRTEIIVSPEEQPSLQPHPLERVLLDPAILNEAFEQSEVLFTEARPVSISEEDWLRQQAQWADGNLRVLLYHQQFSLFVIGCMLYHGQHKQLFSYLGYNSYEQWIYACGATDEAAQAICKKAIDLYELRRPFLLYEVGLEPLLTKDLPEVKRKKLKQQAHDVQRQLSIVADSWKNLSPEAREEAEKQAITEVRESFLHILDQSPQELYNEKRARASKDTDDVRAHPHQVGLTNVQVSGDQMTASLWCKPDPALVRYLGNRYPEITWTYVVRGESHQRTAEEMAQYLEDLGYGKQVEDEDEDEDVEDI